MLTTFLCCFVYDTNPRHCVLFRISEHTRIHETARQTFSQSIPDRSTSLYIDILIVLSFMYVLKTHYVVAYYRSEINNKNDGILNLHPNIL